MCTTKRMLHNSEGYNYHQKETLSVYVNAYVYTYSVFSLSPCDYGVLRTEYKKNPLNLPYSYQALVVLLAVLPPSLLAWNYSPPDTTFLLHEY